MAPGGDPKTEMPLEPFGKDNTVSPCLNNLLTALKLMAASEAVPIRSGNFFFHQVGRLASLDAARLNYYTDEPSRRVFDWVQQYKTVLSFFGHSIPIHLQNAPFQADEWTRLEQQAAAMTPYIPDDYLLDRLDTWILEAYALKGECEALPGDVVLDCGTYTGNTSLYFSQKVGVSGHVYGFEAASATFTKYAHNMRGVDNVTPVHAAVSNTTGVLHFSGDNQGGHIVADGERVPAITLDAFCDSRNLTKIDFIKMDVEGAEDHALEGATDIIRKHRPKMAISAYHNAFDLVALPDRILSIAPYTFKLRHFSNREWETILYCMPGLAARCSPPSLPESQASSRQYEALLLLLLPLLRKIFAAPQQHAMSATQGLHQLVERLSKENAALRERLQKLGAHSDGDQAEQAPGSSGCTGHGAQGALS